MFKTLTFFAALFVTSLSFSQMVSTITSGDFNDSISQDSQGNIYCSNYYGDSVFKYDTNGNVTTFKNGYTNPNGIAVNEQDEIFICDAGATAGANAIFKYDLNGTLLNSYSTGINNPTGIRNIPGTTDMLIVEYNNSTLKRLEANGTVTTLFSGFPLNGPSGIAFVDGEIYVSNFNDRKIMRFENGTFTLVTQLPASAPNNNYIGFITSSGNKIYATHWGEHKIYKIDPITGNSSVYAGSTAGNTDGSISVAQFNFPNGIYADTNNDRLYVSELGSYNMRIIENAALSTLEFDANDIDLNVFIDRISDSLEVKANLKSNEKVSIKIFEITGKEVFNKNYTISDLAFSEHIRKNELTSGAYILLLTQKNRLISKKFIF